MYINSPTIAPNNRLRVIQELTKAWIKIFWNAILPHHSYCSARFRNVGLLRNLKKAKNNRSVSLPGYLSMLESNILKSNCSMSQISCIKISKFEMLLHAVAKRLFFVIHCITINVTFLNRFYHLGRKLKSGLFVLTTFKTKSLILHWTLKAFKYTMYMTWYLTNWFI